MVKELSQSTNPNILIPKPELYPRRDLVVANTLAAMQIAAAGARDDIWAITKGIPEPELLSGDIKKRRTLDLDNMASRRIAAVMRAASFVFVGIDAEGAKEAQEHKLGEAPDLNIGNYGRGDKKVAFALDAIENTRAAAHFWPNAICLVGISELDGITPIPENDGEKNKYVQKLFAPAAFKGAIEIGKPTKENLEAIAKIGHVKDPNQITVAIMDPAERPANKTIAEKANDFGAKIEIVDVGDFSWCVRAMLSDPENPIIVMGRGGAEEGTIAAIGARALGATGQLRAISDADKNEDLETQKRGQIWTADEFIPGAQEHSMVIFSAITQNTDFGLQGARRKSDFIRLVDSIVIDHTGVNKIRDKQILSAPTK